MKTEKRNPWASFDEAFRLMDRAFKDFDWQEHGDVRHSQFNNPADTHDRRVHVLTARSWRSRRRMAWLFLWLAWRILTRGKATVRF